MPGADSVDRAIAPSAIALLSCLEQRMALNPNPPEHFVVRVGSDPVAADFDEYNDYCCQGLVYVRVMRRFPSGSDFPISDELASNCMPTGWGVDLAMGSFRCAPDEFNPEGWLETFQTVQNDQQAMADAICCWKDQQEQENPGNFLNWFSQDWLPFALQGGCTGGEWRITAQFNSCEECSGD
jgi:hypothetical protein